MEGTDNTGRNIRRLGSVLARCGFYGALLAALTAMAAGFGSRTGLWHYSSGFAILTRAAWGGVAAAVVSLIGVLAAVTTRQLTNGILALLGLIAGVVIFAVPFSWQAAARAVPPIHDITTDIVQPPHFVAILPLRQGAPNPAGYGGNEVARQQLVAYPEIKTVTLNVRHDMAFTRAYAAVRALGWKVVAAVPDEGRIEATDTTFWFGFTDDIVIRISPASDRSLIDIRSVSRVGRSDVGTNAKRIRTFIQQLTEY